MCTTFDGVDVVHIRVKVFTESGVVHNGALDGNTLFFGIQVDYVINKRCIVGIQKTYEFFYAFF